jgi:hypothetical protein
MLREKPVGGVSIRSGLVPAMMKENAAPKPCSSTIGQHKLPIKVARIFNIYGPRMHPNDGRVVSTFVIQALLGQDITV